MIFFIEDKNQHNFANFKENQNREVNMVVKSDGEIAETINGKEVISTIFLHQESVKGTGLFSPWQLAAM